jgi:hypothetical protein
MTRFQYVEFSASTLPSNPLAILPPDPMTIDFKGDCLMAKLICATHRFVNADTGEKLVNPDGSGHLYYADEATGLVRYHKGKPSSSGTGIIGYAVRASDGKPFTKWRRRILGFFGIQEECTIATDSYYAPVRFVPIEGREELAMMVRGLYSQREWVNEEYGKMLDGLEAEESE